jgi:SOS-response transcriptional repressor LexA
MDMKRLTRAQLNVFDAIVTNIRRRNYAPSIEEILMVSGHRSKSTVHRHLLTLKAAGYIQWEEGRTRTLKVVKTVSEEDRERLLNKYEYAY